MRKLEFDSIEKSFIDKTILMNIYMSCDVGRVIGLLGRNGSGKSTLMRIVFGTTGATHKSIRIDGYPLLGYYIKKRYIGYLPQHSWVPANLTVHNILKLYDINEDTLIEAFPAFADWRQLANNKLSGGYRRILEVCLLLHSKHPFILLDEPFSGLMPKHVEDIKTLIRSVKRNKGIIISDHLYKHILDLADQTYLLSNAQCYPIKEPDELIRRGYLV